MNFTEKSFVYLLLAVYALWLLTRGHYRAKLFVLVSSSLVFYGFHQWPIVLLILAYCVVDWGVGLWIVQSSRPRAALTVGIAFNLLVLAFWKYTPLLLQTVARLALALDINPPTVPSENWVIPLGISFYTFTGIAYMVDVYRQSAPVERSLWRFTLYKTFFPQLVAGPILRPRDFLSQLQPDTLPERTESPFEATMLIARGLFKKMVLADRIALAIDPFFQHIGDGSTAGVWALPFVYLYALQIYFDFSGYTDIARGLGLLFGFRWPENFNLPYLAVSVQDFWRRWHITLSQFLKEYLYVPLGGNRGSRWRTHLNLMITMLLGGLWHGAAWSFLLWGGLHGAYLVIGKIWAESRLGRCLGQLAGMRGMVWRVACIALTFHAVCLAWCFFRLTVLSESLVCVQKWFSFDADKLLVGGSADLSLWLLLAIYGLFVCTIHFARQKLADAMQDPLTIAHGFRWGFGVALLLLALLMSPGGESPPFIYFQF